MWVKKSAGNVADESFYVSSVISLLKSQSEVDFERIEADFVDRWSPSFGEYFQQNLRASVTSSALFATSHLDIISLLYVGVTNNVSKSYNRVLKDFQNWKVNSQFYQNFGSLQQCCFNYRCRLEGCRNL